MNLKNYTTTVPVQNTISEIEWMLQEFGATAMMKDFANGQIVALGFKLSVQWGDMFIRLPANAEQVYKILTKGKWVNQTKQEQLKARSERIAWRLMKDWLAVQLSLITMKQAEAAQVFLPYAVVGQDAEKKPLTMFQAYRDTQMKALADGRAKPSEN